MAELKKQYFYLCDTIQYLEIEENEADVDRGIS